MYHLQDVTLSFTMPKWHTYECPVRKGSLPKQGGQGWVSLQPFTISTWFHDPYHSQWSIFIVILFIQKSTEISKNLSNKEKKQRKTLDDDTNFILKFFFVCCRSVARKCICSPKAPPHESPTDYVPSSSKNLKNIHGDLTLTLTITLTLTMTITLTLTLIIA